MADDSATLVTAWNHGLAFCTTSRLDPAGGRGGLMDHKKVRINSCLLAILLQGLSVASSSAFIIGINKGGPYLISKKLFIDKSVVHVA